MRSLGFDYINYQAVVPDNTYTKNDGSVYNVDFWLREREVEELEKIVEELVRIKEGSGRIRNTKRYLRLMPLYFKLKDKFRPDRCMAGFRIINIDPYGNINICGLGPNINVRDGELRKLWSSREYRKARVGIKRCRIPCMMLCYEKLNLRSLYRSWLDARLGLRLGYG
jgi:MoaA/NifB/PqqE/SkfB family radical SAM enzyme